MAALTLDPPPSAPALPAVSSDDFVECYRAHYRRLVRALTLAGATPAVAEDVTQEAFARALARWRRVRTGTNPPGYVYRTAFRLLGRSTRDGRGGADGQGGAAPGAGVAEPGPEGLATSQVSVHRALAAMPPRRRACAVMCLVAGMPVRDVAEALGIAEGTVRKHLEEARAALHLELSDHGGTPAR